MLRHQSAVLAAQDEHLHFTIVSGVYGGQPNLENLIKGNLRHRVDFRSVYSKAIRDWLGCDPVPVFGQETFDTIVAPDLPELGFLPLPPSSVRDRAWRGYR